MEASLAVATNQATSTKNIQKFAKNDQKQHSKSDDGMRVDAECTKTDVSGSQIQPQPQTLVKVQLTAAVKDLSETH